MAGARGVDVDGGIDPALGETTVEAQLHVAGALELLEDRLVHAAVRLDEGGGEDRQRPTLFDVAGGAEELLRRVQRAGVDAARQDPATRRSGEVVGAAETGDAVEDHDDVLAHLDHPLGLLDRHLGDLGVLFARSVERRRDDLTLDEPADVGDLLGPLVDEQHDQPHVGVVLLDRAGDGLHDRRLAGLRRRHDDAALALADRRDEVDDPGHHVARLRRVFEHQPLVGEQRGEVLETRPGPRRLGVETVDRVDLEQRRVLLVAAGGPSEPGDLITLAQAVLAGELDRDVGVVAARQVAVDTEEAVALVAHVEIAADLDRFVADRFLDLEQVAVVALRAFLAALALAAPATTTIPAVAVLFANRDAACTTGPSRTRLSLTLLAATLLATALLTTGLSGTCWPAPAVRAADRRSGAVRPGACRCGR